MRRFPLAPLLALPVLVYAQDYDFGHPAWATPSMGSMCCSSRMVITGSFLDPEPQEATLNTPVPRNSEAKLKVRALGMSQASWWIEVSVQDSVDSEIRVQAYSGPDTGHVSATTAALLTAIDTVRATETGGVLRRANFRILGFLLDQGYLSGVTLVP